MYKEWIGLRVILKTTAEHKHNLVGTLTNCIGTVVMLDDITPVRMTRPMGKESFNIASRSHEGLVPVADPLDDPSKNIPEE